MPSEKRTLTIASVAAEPKTWNDKHLWPAMDSEGVEWTIWEDRLVAAVKERLSQPVEYEVSISQKGDKTYRSLQGIPGIVERERKQGGGRQWQPRDYRAEALHNHPSMAAAYAKDLVAAGKRPVDELLAEADNLLRWMNNRLPGETPKETPAVPQVQPQPPQEATQQQASPAPSANGSELTPEEKALAIPLRGEIKRLDPQENFAKHSELNAMNLEALQQIKREILAGELAR